MQCLIYARVSTTEQADKELSIPAQLLACRHYAHQRNWQVSQEFVEPGVSARTADRPKLHQLIARCRNHRDPVNVVLVHKIDRLARNVADHAMITALLKREGVRLASVVENLDDSVSGQLVEHIMAAIAEFHSANLSEETKKGMRQKVLQGGWPHLPPRGYRTTHQGARSKVIIAEIEGPLMVQAFELYATGWYSVKRLAEHLFELGLRLKSQGPLPPSHLTRLLRNPFYVGQIKWKDLQVTAEHAALISTDVFDRVQRILQIRHSPKRHPQNLLGFPLRVVGTCASCRGHVTVDRKPGHAYYRCSRQGYRRDLCDEGFCRVERAHDDLERLCRDIQIGGRSLWERYGQARDAERLWLLEQVFESITISKEGIVDFTLRQDWQKTLIASEQSQRLIAA